MEIILDFVRGEGIAEGKPVPPVITLGSDSFEGIKGSCEETLQALSEWKGVIVSTDILA